MKVRPFPAVGSTFKKGIGRLLAMESTYIVNRNFSFDIDAYYFVGGTYVKATGAGKDITYLLFKGTYEF